MYPDSFNHLLRSSQGRNPTWGRPARRSRQRRSRLPSCSSRSSGRWRTSSTSLHWSNSSSSGHMLSEKRMGNSTCWHKTSSMRKSTPKIKETHVNWRVWSVMEKDGHFCKGSDVQSETKKRRKVRVSVIDYYWLCGRCVHVIENITWSCRTICFWRSDQTGNSSVIHICASQLDKELVLAGCVPSSSQASTPFLFHVKGRLRRRSLLAHGQRRPLQQLIRPRLLIGFTIPDPDKTFSLALYCLVVFCCILTLYYGCLLYVKTVTFFMVKQHPHASPPLLT